MGKYGFNGVDLDWEYPGTPERGGERADTQNYVSLVKEMKAAFGGQYGISLTLAPDYWYLRVRTFILGWNMKTDAFSIAGIRCQSHGALRRLFRLHGL